MVTRTTFASLSLGLEELVVLLGLLGYSEVAKGLLVSHLGEVDSNEERGRLMAANHSLMAKNILYLENDSIRMVPEYARLLGALIANDFAVRTSVRVLGETEHTLTYYVRNEQLIEHRITHGVVHTFQDVASIDDALSALLAFLEVDGIQPFQISPFVITREKWELAQAKINDESDAAVDHLREQQVPEESAALLAEDLQQQVMRGAAMQLKVDFTSGLVADAGYLILKGASGRVWLLEIKEAADEARLLIQSATTDRLKQVSRILFTLSV